MSENPFDVSGTVAVVTGAAGGLGLAMAQFLADAGATVACLDIDAEAVGALNGERNSGGHLAGYQCDVSDADAVEKVLARVARELGPMDLLVNNAGISDPSPGLAHESDLASWHRVIDIDLHGVYYCARAALRQMAPRRSGKIVNVASMWGLAAPSGMLPLPGYAAAKAAVINLTRELALQYASLGITVNALCPGFVRTGLGHGAYDNPGFIARLENRIPLGRIAETTEFRGPTLFLASSASDYMTGACLVFDGGYLAG